MLTAQSDTAGAGQSRAQRFEISTPIRYRVSGQSEWGKGMTENISSSGVLFRCEHSVGPETPIEMSWAVPVGAFGSGGARVYCRGAIVRTRGNPGDLTTVAASISHYRLMRP